MTDAKENKEGSDNLLQSEEFSADRRKDRDSDRKREWYRDGSILRQKGSIAGLFFSPSPPVPVHIEILQLMGWE